MKAKLIRPRRSRLPWLFAVFIAAGLILASLPFVRGLAIKTFGQEVTPRSALEPRPVQIFLQNDPAWAAEELGVSGCRMASSGCLVSCVAMAMCDLGMETDPGALNRALREAGAYTEEGDLIWSALAELGVTHEYSRDFGAQYITDLLAEGLLPIVRVKYRGTGADHWVLVVGSTEQDFLIADPLNVSGEPIPLQTHGRLYACRALRKA